MRATTVDRAIHPQRTWHAVLGRLELEMTAPNFATWMEGTQAIDYADGVLTVEARSAFACEWLNSRLRPMVERAAAQVADCTLTVEFVPPRAEPGEEEPPSIALAHPGRAEPEPARLIGAFNEAFRLECYLETEGNLLARNACRDMLDDGAFAMTPLVVYGSPGVGKTHLLHGIARAAHEERRDVACLSAEQFTNRYLTAMRDRDATGFQESLRNVRLLVLDDLQYLEGKTGTANELVHTIDAIVHAGGDVVVAAERHPAEMNLPERLISRLSAGLVVRIEPFRSAERRRYVEQMAAHHGVELPEWAASRLASLEGASVRALRGAVNRALMLARCGRLTAEQLDADLVSASVAATVQRPEDGHEQLLDRVARVFEVAVSDLVGRSRRRDVAAARAVAAAVLRERGMSLAEAAEALGGRDRSTIRQLAERGREIATQEPAARAMLAS